MQKKMPKISIIGAGAAGCFCAIEIARNCPGVQVEVFEAGRKPLAKVAVTGGGRCNLTNSFEDIRDLKEAYPRGHQVMKRAFYSFDQNSTWEWFEKEGVRLTLQEDRCVFPVSQDAMQIVKTLLKLMDRYGVTLHTGTKVEHIRDIDSDFVVLTTGGTNKTMLESLLDGTGTGYEEPVASLFTFKAEGMTDLMGTVVENASASIPGTKFKANGPLLITDWGFSGPSILKLSSYAARHLHDNGYKSPLLINWLGKNTNGKEFNADQAREILDRMAAANPQKQLASIHPEVFSSRLWESLLVQAGLSPEKRWAETGSKGLAKLASVLTGAQYEILGRARFKDEFVTCGGVSLSDVNLSTLEAKNFPGLYFAGEVLDIDAITGGFNLQAAWSTAYTAARSIISCVHRTEGMESQCHSH